MSRATRRKPNPFYLGAWIERARCRGMDTSIFFGHDQLEAKRICATCPVREDCLEAAMKIGDLAHGVWGGTSERERRKLRRLRRRIDASRGRKEQEGSYNRISLGQEGEDLSRQGRQG